MTGFLVDTSVLLDILTEDPEWYSWSSAQLTACAAVAPIYLNTIVYAEASVAFPDEDAFLAALPAWLEYADLPRAAAFLAGKAFLAYRRAGGQRPSPLPDFFIGAHALVQGLTLITRNGKDFLRRFSGLKVLAPPPHRRARPK